MQFRGILLVLISVLTVSVSLAQEWVRFQGKNGKYGFKVVRYEVVKPIYDDAATSFSEEMGAVKQKGKWGYLNKSNRLVIPCQYDQAGPFQKGIAKVTMGDRTFFIDKTGKEVDPNDRPVVSTAPPKPIARPKEDVSVPKSALPVAVKEVKGAKEITLGDRKYYLSRRETPERETGFYKLTGDLDKISMTALANKSNQDRFFFDFKKKELTASQVVHIPGLGLAGLALEKDVSNETFDGRIAWYIFEDNGKVFFPGYNDYAAISGLQSNGITADRMLYFGMYEKADFTKSKFYKSVLSYPKHCYVSYYLNGERTHLWEDVQNLWAHADVYFNERRSLYQRKGENGSLIFVNAMNDSLTTYVVSAELGDIKKHENTVMVATNDGSSGTAYVLNNAKFQGKSPMYGPQLGPISHIQYTILIPAEEEGYYKVIDENGLAYSPEESYGLLPFVTRHSHVKTGLLPRYGLNKNYNGFEILHFLMAALKRDGELVWQPVNHFGKPYPSQENTYFKHWEMADSRTLQNENAINALPYFMLAYTVNNKWQAYFPSRYGISHLPDELLKQYSSSIAPLTGEFETADEAYEHAEVQIQVIQQTHIDKKSEAFAIYQMQSDLRREEYRRRHAARPSWKLDWSGLENMHQRIQNHVNYLNKSANGGVISPKERLEAYRYYMGKSD